MADSQQQLSHYVQVIGADPSVTERLPGVEAEIVRSALGGQTVSEIAQEQRMSEGAVWNLIQRVANDVTGSTPVSRVESGGLGSDTDPGVTGGYGDTGFGSLGNEPPVPDPGEPTDQR